MKAIFIIITLLIFSITAILVFSKIPAATTTQTLSLSGMQTTPTPQPSVNMQEVNKAVAQGPKNLVAQGPQRPTKVSPPTPQPAQPGQSIKFTTTSLNNDIIEIGTERHSPPKPYVKLTKWEGEAMLKVHVPFNTGDNPQQLGDKLRYFGDKVKIDFYPKQPQEITQKDSLGNEHKFIINEDGGVEFDTILEEKPAVNYIVFPIETQGLKFYHQPPLNEEPQEEGVTCTATTCAKNGQIVDFRPEEVVDSYAVYIDGKSGDYSATGGKNYKTGKAFHIYRPKIIDSKGQETWGKLKVNENEKTLTLIIDQNWLNNASYPVIVDPTFGYTGSGTTEGSGNDARIQAVVYQAGAGILTRIYFLSGNSANGGALRLGLYADNGSTYPGNLLDGSVQLTQSSNTWVFYNTKAVSLAAGTNYWLAYKEDGANIFYRYDSTTPPQRYVKSGQEIGAMPNPFPAAASSSTTRRISIYGTYVLQVEFNFGGLKMNGVKIQ